MLSGDLLSDENEDGGARARGPGGIDMLLAGASILLPTPLQMVLLVVVACVLLDYYSILGPGSLILEFLVSLFKFIGVLYRVCRYGV